MRDAASGGPWQLTVADHAPVDVGRLRTWSIEVGEARPLVEARTAPGLATPETGTGGIASELVFTDEGTVSTLMVELDITHRYADDLEVTLCGPDRRRAVLHKRGGPETDRLLLVLTSSGGGPLAPFVGKPITGGRTLQITDRDHRDIGKLNRWALRAVL